MTVLDEAYERLEGAWLEDQRGFVNHGPMACEALFAMGLEDEVVAWADRSAQPHRDTTVRRTRGGVGPDWQEHLGRFSMLEEWVTHFELAIEEGGWRDTVATWVPRLSPSMETKLFHPLIRTAHATRAIGSADTAPRRHELAFALGYWASRYSPGAKRVVQGETTFGAERDSGVDEIRARIGELAAGAARRFVAHPDVYTLHGVTSAMAVHLLAGQLPTAAARSGLAELESSHREVFGNDDDTTLAEPRRIDRTTVATRAADTGDVHVVKLTEAALRGLDATADPVFALAAETVTRRG
jgi:hypothetical protein